MNPLSPVVLFVYNRFQHTLRTVEALRANVYAAQSKLYIYSDGPKNDEDRVEVEKIRDYLKSIDGFLSVCIFHRKENFGLAQNIISGVTQVMQEHDKAIVLEDDLVSSKYFLKFINEALENYRDNPKIFSVTGFNLRPDLFKIPQSYPNDVFINYRICSWGWGSWRDRWQKTDWELKDYDHFKNDRKILKSFDRGGDDLSEMLKLQMEGKLNSWAIRWYHAHFKHDAFCLFPVRSYISNIGHDRSGVHCDNSDRFSNDVSQALENVRFDQSVDYNPDMAKRYNEFFLTPKIIRLRKKIKRLIKPLLDLKRKRVLILRSGGIGDFVIFMYFLKDYRELFKDHLIYIVCNKNAKELIETCPYVDHIKYVDFNKIFRKKHWVYTCIKIMEFSFFRFDMVLNSVYSRSRHEDQFIKSIPAKEKIAFDGDDLNYAHRAKGKIDAVYTKIINSAEVSISEFDRNVEFIKHLGAAKLNLNGHPILALSSKGEQACGRLLETLGLADKDYAVFFPGAGHQIRCWDPHRWHALIVRFLENYSHMHILLLGQGADIAEINKITDCFNSRLPAQLEIVHNRTNLMVLSKIIERSKLFVGVETGPTHIAAAVGTPNVCIMGGGHFGRFYPYGNLDKNRMVFKRMECFGCNWNCIYDKSLCIADISAEEVLNEIKSLI